MTDNDQHGFQAFWESQNESYFGMPIRITKPDALRRIHAIEGVEIDLDEFRRNALQFLANFANPVQCDKYAAHIDIEYDPATNTLDIMGAEHAGDVADMREWGGTGHRIHVEPQLIEDFLFHEEAYNRLRDLLTPAISSVQGGDVHNQSKCQLGLHSRQLELGL